LFALFYPYLCGHKATEWLITMKDILVTQSSMSPVEEYIEEIYDIWESKQLTNMGVKHQQLIRMLQDRLQTENVELLVNGHMALELSLQALHLSGEVITTPFTFVSTTHAIVRNGLTPVFCDIHPTDFTMDVSAIEKHITEKTCAIMPVHVYGNICNVEEIDRIAQKHNLKVIYDAAHAFGEVYKGRNVSNYGDVSCYSFHATKVFNTIEGGAACFRDKKVGEVLHRLINFGIQSAEKIVAVGPNAKMNEFCAAMGICNLRHLDGEIKKRKLVHERYTENLKNIDGITLRQIQPDVESNYAYYPIVIDQEVYGHTRDELFAFLEANGIRSRKYFYPAINDCDVFKGMYDPNDTPVALSISKRVLTLPLYADLPLDVVDRICDLIMSFAKN